MTHDYFYGREAEGFSFYRLPRALFKDKAYKHLSTDARLLYGLLLDRMALSLRNEWLDGQRRIYIYYTLEEIQDDLSCGHDKAVRLLAELEKESLLERRRQGQGKPAMLYVKRLYSPSGEESTFRLPNFGSQKRGKAEGCISRNQTSALPKSRSPNFRKPDANKKDSNYTECSYIYPSIPAEEVDAAELRERVREQIDFPLLAQQYPYDDMDAYVELICDVLQSSLPTLRIAGEELPAVQVRRRFEKLCYEHVVYVQDSLRDVTTDIRNIRAYLLTALYHAPTTIGSYYSAAVRRDNAKGD